MKVNISRLNNEHYVSTISIDYLLYSIEKNYNKSIKTIEKEYSSEKISEDYSEYVISSILNCNLYLDSIVLFTKEKFERTNDVITINKFVVADGISKLIIINNLLETKNFILRRISDDNINIFKDLYKELFIKQTQIPGYYLDIVLGRLKSTYAHNINTFAKEFLNNKMSITIVTGSNKYSISEYISHKNVVNKLLTPTELSKKINFKMTPYEI